MLEMMIREKVEAPPTPATARKMNIRVQVNPTGATAPRIRTHQTAISNSRLIGVSAWQANFKPTFLQV